MQSKKSGTPVDSISPSRVELIAKSIEDGLIGSSDDLKTRLEHLDSEDLYFLRSIDIYDEFFFNGETWDYAFHEGQNFETDLGAMVQMYSEGVNRGLVILFEPEEFAEYLTVGDNGYFQCRKDFVGEVSMYFVQDELQYYDDNELKTRKMFSF